MPKTGVDNPWGLAGVGALIALIGLGLVVVSQRRSHRRSR
ncbi:LPXTG cell wall anchor domain-containing protein [Amycolatopsis sp. SID8362]|nr:LPXTG cell wall anchor domain-containing protein [Amycolatopsis sp. SID8362]NED44190.1 LPXTG cell wall anchor domain-containing protein [Amycolatopsis sp. SID8362]